MASLFGSNNIWKLGFNEVVTKFGSSAFDTTPTVFGVVILLEFILIPVIMTANGIVLAAIWKDPYKQLRSSPSNIIIASMACCDLLVGLSNTLIVTAYLLLRFKGESWAFVPQLYLSIITALIGLSVLHVFSLTIDRLIAVIRPMRYRSLVTRGRAHFYVIFIWCFYLCLSLSQIPLQNYFYIFSLAFFIPLNLMIAATATMSLVIIFQIWKPSRELRKIQDIPARLDILRQRNRKATKSILLIVGIFKTCFTPFSICWMIILTCNSCQDRMVDIMRAYSLSICIMILNSCINPFLYAFRIPKFKKPVYYIANRLFCCCCKSRITVEASISRSNDVIDNHCTTKEENHLHGGEETNTAL